jgi:membrane protein YdbS with pleckstrin-like domain
MRYPRRLLGDDEEVLAEFRPHWRVLLGALAWAMALTAAAGVALAALEGPWDLAAVAAAPILWLVVASRPVLRWWFTSYVLTSERIIVRRGMVARSGTEIPLENIVNVLFSQRVLERLLGYGDVLVESAGSQGQSRLKDVPDPQGFQTEIYRARELRSLHLSGHVHGGHADVVTRLERLADLRERGHLSDEEFERAKHRLLDEDGT